MKCPKHGICNGSSTISCAPGYFVRKRYGTGNGKKGPWFECAKGADKTGGAVSATSTNGPFEGITCPKGYHLASGKTARHDVEDVSRWFDYCVKN